MEGGTLNLSGGPGGTHLALDNLGTKAVWSGGALSQGGHQDSSIFVHNGTTLTIKTDAIALGASLQIGLSLTGADQLGTVNIGEETSGLSANLTLYNGVYIYVRPLGVLNLKQPVNSGTKGGITKDDPASNNKIENEGRINRTVVDPDATQFLQLGVKVINVTDSGAVFFIAEGAKVNFGGGLDLNTGTFLEHKKSADWKGDINKLGGEKRVVDAGGPGRYYVYLSGELVGVAGDFTFVQETPGAFGTAVIAGDFALGAGWTLTVNLEDGATDSGDRLAVAGAVTLAGILDAVPTANFVGGAPFTLLEKLGTDAIDGYFSNLPPGDLFVLGDWVYEITYEGGDGNDVVLLPVQFFPGQWADDVIDFSSEYGPSPGDWSADQALRAPDTLAYGDAPTTWTPALADDGIQYLTVGFATPVYATGVTIRETYGNGFVVGVDLLDEFGQPYFLWSGTDPSPPGTPVNLTFLFPATNFLVTGVRVYIDTDLNPGDWEEIDAVMLHGEAGGGGGGLAVTGSPGASTTEPRGVRVLSVRQRNRGPSATFRAAGPVQLGVPVTFLFTKPRGGSGFHYSFDFNNDGDFTDPGEYQAVTSPSATHTFATRGWHVVRGRIQAADGRFTDFWARVFVS